MADIGVQPHIIEAVLNDDLGTAPVSRAFTIGRPMSAKSKPRWHCGRIRCNRLSRAARARCWHFPEPLEAIDGRMI